jgi:hypothetical protein
MTPTETFIQRKKVESPHSRTLRMLEAAIAGLTTIKEHYGRVCEEYEICNHAACNSSYGAWAVTDEALSKIDSIASEAPDATSVAESR